MPLNHRVLSLRTVVFLLTGGQTKLNLRHRIFLKLRSRLDLSL